MIQDNVNHPKHYGGPDNPYEAIKVIEAWDLGFHLGNVVKYISRCGKKSGNLYIDDIRKAQWYLDRYIAHIEEEARRHGKDDKVQERSLPRQDESSAAAGN